MRKLFLILMTLVAVSWSAMAQNRTYSGTVLDAANNEPLIGATVMPVGGGIGTATDVDGKFSLTVPAKVKKVTVSYVGMTPQTVTLADGMTVKLQSSDSNLDELVVLGYGSAKKLGSVVGSVSVVGEKAMENLPAATFIDGLQGQVAGLNIYSNSGDPSSTNNAVSIRGVSSINAGTTPLYILDGAPVNAAIFTTLNPDDIASVTVLKDAAAVAIYGSRAANGVIIITSKKGKYGEKSQVTISANVGWSQMVDDPQHMMNSKQYIEFRDKIGSPVNDEVREVVDKYGISTDWVKDQFKDNALMYSLNAKVSGGSERLNYYISLNHYYQDGIIQQSNMQRETLRANINSRVNDWFAVGLSANLGYSKYQTNYVNNMRSEGVYVNDPMVFARMAFPYDSPYYYTIDENGDIHYGERAMQPRFWGYTVPDFMVWRMDPQRRKITANLNLYEQITPIPGLVIRAQQAVDALDYTYTSKTLPYESYITPFGDLIGSNAPGYLNTANRQRDFERYYSWTFTNTAEYTKTIADVHNINALIGQESIVTKDDSFGAYTNGQTNEKLYLLQQGTNALVANQTESIDRQTFNSFFAKLGYNFDNRYFVEGSYRRDGSSLFAPGHRWSNFYSVGAMWNAKNEKFLQPVEWLNELMLRVSYGTTGNSFISNYAYFGLVGSYNGGYGAGNPTAMGVAGASNDELTWETVASFDLGLHFRIFNILTVDVDYYNKKTTDMLMQIPWSFTTGFDEGWGNVGSMRNQGVDLTLSADIIRNKDWYWGVRANFNYNKNRILELFNGRDSYILGSTGRRLQIGHDQAEYYAVRYVGVDPADGKQVWLDKNGNKTKVYNEEENSVMTGMSFVPPYTGGFGTTLSWKGLSLSCDFNWAAKKYMMNNEAFFLHNASQGDGQNQSVDMLNVWTKPGDITIYPNADQEPEFDTRFIENASFLRLKNLTLAYSFPKYFLDRLHLEGLTLHFTGRNLWTVTDFTGYDPEPMTNMYRFSYPNTRNYEFGVEVSF